MERLYEFEGAPRVEPPSLSKDDLIEFGMVDCPEVMQPLFLMQKIVNADLTVYLTLTSGQRRFALMLKRKTLLYMSAQTIEQLSEGIESFRRTITGIDIV